MRELIGFVLAFCVLCLALELMSGKGACVSLDGVQHCLKFGTDGE